MKLATLLAVLASTLLAACGRPAEDLVWKQEVPLQDGRIIVLERLSRVEAEDVLQRQRKEGEQLLKFAHPDTGQRVEWSVPRGLLPYALEVDQGVPYYVATPYTVADYNQWKCPNPPFISFKYADNQWQRIALDELPPRIAERNLLARASYQEKYIVNGYVTQERLRAFISDIDSDRRVINRQKISPIGEGCYESNLRNQGRDSEIYTGR